MIIRGLPAKGLAVPKFTTQKWSHPCVSLPRVRGLDRGGANTPGDCPCLKIVQVLVHYRYG
jgi:hypothetical protein